MRTFTLAASIAVVSAFCAQPALADVPPPEGYVETCTVAKQATASTECLECRAYYGANTRCQTMLEPFCYTRVCKSYGASVWNEVFCRAKNASAPVVPQSITDALPMATTPVPSVPNPGVCPANTTATGTGTGTATPATSTGTGTVTAATDTGTGTATAATSTGTGTVTAATSTGTGTVTAATSTGTGTVTAATSTGTGTVTAATSTGTGTVTAATSTGTATDTSVNPVAEKNDDSGCSYGNGNVLRTLGPWSIALVGVLLAALRRRRK